MFWPPLVEAVALLALAALSSRAAAAAATAREARAMLARRSGARSGGAGECPQAPASGVPKGTTCLCEAASSLLYRLPFRGQQAAALASSHRAGGTAQAEATLRGLRWRNDAL